METTTILDKPLPKDVRLALCKRVRMRRKEQKLSQVALAEKADASHS